MDICFNDNNQQSRENDRYDDFLASIRSTFEKNISGNAPVFRTNARFDFDHFLMCLPYEARQHYNCNACRHFINHFGSLATVNEKGELIPVMWGEVPVFFSNAVKSIRFKMKSAKIIGVFKSDEKYLGTPQTGIWKHMAVPVFGDLSRKRNRLNTAHQEASDIDEEHRMLCDACSKYSIETVKTALQLLRSDSLYNGERVLGVAEWFYNILEEIEDKKKNRTNILWLRAATAPVGFCHIFASMIGTLLDDIQAGYRYEDVADRFASKMNPLRYQRPSAAPSAGNVAEAEKIVAKLGIEPSLRRRYARLEEVQAIWKPTAEKVAVSSGVFSGIKTKQKKGQTFADPGISENHHPVTMTFEKFRRTVLPTAKKIEYLIPNGTDHFSALVTAADPSAPPILQWDVEENRNPVNWYVYNGGSLPYTFNLRPGCMVQVDAVVLQPNMWQPGYDHVGKAVFFILNGAKDTNHTQCGSALFPSVLKSELHAVRSTIEAYSNNNQIEGYEQSTACGVRCQAGNDWKVNIRVTSDVGVTNYKLDRWD